MRIRRAPKPREQSQNPAPLVERIERLTPALSLLLQVDGLIVSGLVELCTPHPVHALVFGSTEGQGRPESNVEVAEIFQSPDQSLVIELRAIALQRCNQHAGVDITLERHVIRRLPGKVLSERRFIVEDQR